ncbi:MAG TPA: VOC family protein [Streptosporangiaceae bacterium]|nr:VOC family protein [Streptosporangiaceae bacterium]
MTGPTSPAGLPLTRVDHVAIAVRDADAALPYYTQRLGLPVIGDEIAEEPGVRLVYLDAGNTFVQLVQPVRPGPVAGWLDEHGEGLHHICFAAPDLAEVLGTLGDSAPIFRGGRGRNACFLSDRPNNVAVELTESEPSR